MRVALVTKNLVGIFNIIIVVTVVFYFVYTQLRSFELWLFYTIRYPDILLRIFIELLILLSIFIVLI